MDDAHFMTLALQTAARIPGRPWPNPPVGAVVVLDGEIVGAGAHHGPGLSHAEVAALGQAGPRARGATLYCTLEPCNHAGRTPPCVPQVIDAGIRRVVVAVADPNPRVTGGGLERIRDAGIEVALGVLPEPALEMIWPFVATRAFERPFVLLKTATSLDGRFGPPPGSTARPDYLTGIDARREVHRLRRWADVVLIGEGTLVADQPALNGRHVAADDPCPAADPLPAYVDSDMSFSGGWPWHRFAVFADRNRVTEQARLRVEKAGGTIFPCDAEDGHVLPDSVLDAIFRDIGKSVMIEAGPRLSSAFLHRGLVDRWISYTAPVLLGSGPTWPDAATSGPSAPNVVMSLTRTATLGGDAKCVFDRFPFAASLHEATEARRSRLRLGGTA